VAARQQPAIEAPMVNQQQALAVRSQHEAGAGYALEELQG
jgi:hypothetical protein